MKLTKAIWTLGLVAPATIIPLTTATSCSQVWGYKTPISIGSNIKGSALDPYVEFKNDTALFDLNGNLIVPQLQSNFAVDMARGSYYGYSLPEKWNSNKEWKEETSTYKIEGKGGFEEGTAAWHTYSSDAFVTQISRTGKKTILASGEQSNVSEVVNSYRNNMLGMNIELTSIIGTAINQFMNYALHYQGTQIGQGWTSETETTSDLGISWGGNFTHGTNGSDANKNFYESVFATNAVSGTGKSQAACRPTHVEFNYVDMPIPAYNTDKTVSDYTKILLNGTKQRPSEKTSSVYWSARSDKQDENYTDMRTGEKYALHYQVYTYTNVPVRVKFNAFAKSYVNPTISSGYQVSDFYSNKDTINGTIGNSWAGSLDKFATGATKPSASSFQFKSPHGGTKIDPVAVSGNTDGRIAGTLEQDDFVVLLNYAYKEYTDGKIDDVEITDQSILKAMDRVTMTGLSTVFPACFCDTNMKLKETTFFKPANTISGVSAGFIFNEAIVNNWNNAFLSLVKRTSSESMSAPASKLSDKSKELLKFLAYMFGNSSYAVDTANCITITELK